MSNWITAYLLGIATGLAVGLFFPRGQTRWSDLSGTNKILHICLALLAIVLLAVGIVTIFVT